MTTRKHLWQRLTIRVDFDDPALVAEFTPAQILKFASFEFTPTKHGLRMRRRGQPIDSGHTYQSSWELLSMLIDWAWHEQAKADNAGGLATATGRFHHDRAALYRFVYFEIATRRGQLFPTEEPTDQPDWHPDLSGGPTARAFEQARSNYSVASCWERAA
jgi:hypothetical protein